MPPAAFVSTTTEHPARQAVRTACTTTAGACPSYPWTRPRNASTRRPPGAASDRTTPAWPTTVEGRNPGRSVTATSATTEPSRSTAGRHPEPSTTATSCASTPVSDASSDAARPASS
jgi:hypothetical protein